MTEAVLLYCQEIIFCVLIKYKAWHHVLPDVPKIPVVTPFWNSAAFIFRHRKRVENVSEICHIFHSSRSYFEGDVALGMVELSKSHFPPAGYCFFQQPTITNHTCIFSVCIIYVCGGKLWTSYNPSSAVNTTGRRPGYKLYMTFCPHGTPTLDHFFPRWPLLILMFPSCFRLSACPWSVSSLHLTQEWPHLACHPATRLECWCHLSTPPE